MLGIRRAMLCGAVALTTVTAGCASMRGVSVGSESANYAVEVTNTMPHSMAIYWSDGGEEKLLGNVGSGQVERFIIAGSKTPRVTITARDANRTHSRPYTVDLTAGTTQRIRVS
jgi:hypothetical protein